jgi:hypothetical protein
VNITEAIVHRVISETKLGEIERIDMVKKKNEKGHQYQCVFIRFKYWHTNDNALIARERLLNGKDIKIIYDDPWFWKITAYRENNSKKINKEKQI